MSAPLPCLLYAGSEPIHIEWKFLIPVTECVLFHIIANEAFHQISSSRELHPPFFRFRPSILGKQTVYSSWTNGLFT